MKPLALALAVLLFSPAARAGEPATAATQKSKAIQERYAKALQFYGNGHYSRAILEWAEVLRKDPAQRTAARMIEVAHEMIDTRDKQKQDEVFGYIQAGNYQRALVALQPLLERDPMHPLYTKMQTRIERVVAIVNEAPANRAWRAAATGMIGYAGREDDFQLAYDGLRYAEELAPGEKRFRRLKKLVLEEDPELVQDRVTPGMQLLEYKKFAALNHIYDGKYHVAIRRLEQVLALEPNDVVALKRLGSAYYALDKKTEARSAWMRALELSPTDAQLRKFVLRTKGAIPPRENAPETPKDKPEEKPAAQKE